MRAIRTPIVAALIAGALAGGIAVTALSQDDPAAWPEMTGTWTGQARFAIADGTVLDDPETVIIDRQDGELLWGKVTWTDDAGAPQESLILGTIRADHTTVVLTEATATWTGTLDGDTMTTLLEFHNGGDDHGVAEVVLTRE